MKLKTLAFAALVAASTVAAHADTMNSLPLSSQGVYSMTDGVELDPGHFTDTYYLTFVDQATSSSTATFSLTNLKFKNYVNITGLNVSLYDNANPSAPLALTTLASNSWSYLMNTATQYVLKVSGNAVGSLGGSYALSISTVQAAPVPEPASVALFLAGIGALGLVGRRRKMAEKDHADAALA